MATVISRTVAATPARGASETWEKIAALLAPNAESSARAEIRRAAGVGASVIASEATTDDAIVVCGSGPRVRVYCAFGDDAITGEGVNEDALVSTPTEGDWTMSIPCPAEDLDWIQGELKSCSARITARAVGSDVPEKSSNSTMKSIEATVDLGEFLKS